MKILIIEDDVVDCEMIKRSITISNVEYIEKVSCEEALVEIKQNNFDCILLDHMLPDCESLDLIEEIRHYNLIVPIIVITGRGEEMLASSVLKAGADDYIPKNKLTPKVLTERIERVTNHSLETLLPQLHRIVDEINKKLKEH